MQIYKDRIKQKCVVSPSGCWEFQQGDNLPNRYPKMVFNGKVQAVHRVAYELFIGPIPEGLFVCHKCDNRRCCNPDHLFVGTHLDNMIDMEFKGRANRVGRQSLIPPETVEQIRQSIEDGNSVQEVAISFGYRAQTIRRIARSGNSGLCVPRRMNVPSLSLSQRKEVISLRYKMSVKEIASRFGVSNCVIRKINAKSLDS